jgi:hypothetical protein
MSDEKKSVEQTAEPESASKKAASTPVPSVVFGNEDPKYTRKELIEGFREFKTAKAVVDAALHYYGIESATIKEAGNAVKKFLEREVK